LITANCAYILFFVFILVKVICDYVDFALLSTVYINTGILLQFTTQFFCLFIDTSITAIQSMLAILVLCLVGIAVAQRPQPCITPPQWEARVFDTNEQQRLAVRGRLSYDAVYHRERIIDEVDEGPTVDNYDTISLFDLKVEFIFNFRLRNCSRREITRPWRDFGIRANDTSYGEAYIGSSAVPGANILVTIW
jgi:hypothetical protein